MSNTNNTSNNIPIVPITIPELTSVEYATGLSDAFDNINSNFATLANHEFVKGDPGKSVKIHGENISDYKDIITRAIINAYNLSGVTIQDDIWQNIDNNNEIIYMIYNTDNAVLNDETPISSLYYVFIDGRYDLIKNNEIDFNEIPDLSCIVVYKPNSDGTPNFEVLKNQFPTIYYESGVGLCWKINGSNTGLPVRGLTGKDGINASMQIVRCDTFEPASIDNSLIGEIVGVYDIYNGYITLDDDSKATFIENHKNQSAIILSTDMNDINNGFYFGVIDVNNDGNPIAKTDQRCSITNGFDTQAINDAMRSIDLLDNGNNGSSGIKGLFIPIKASGTNGQPVHLLSATSITNTEDNASSDKNDVILTPINDIVNLNVTNDNKLQVDKYLVLKVNKNNTNNIFTYNNNNLRGFFEENNYLLQYKLINKITERAALGSDDIVVDENTQLPSLFSDALSANGSGIYKWEIFGYDGHVIVNSPFKTIYTLTVNPSITSEIMWYGKDNDNVESWFGNVEKHGNVEVYNELVFSFNKFEPFFAIANDFTYNNDTALNINYNINITGKENESRNVTVKGAVNCDDLYVYNLSAAGEIKDIYTKDDIVGEKGLKLASVTNNDATINLFEVNASGDVKSKSITSDTVETDKIYSDTTNNRQLITKELFVNDNNDNRLIYVGDINNVNNDDETHEHILGAEINNISSLSISRSQNKTIDVGNNDEDDKKIVPSISSNVPLLQNDSSNIIISNTDNTSDNGQLCYYGVSKQYGDDTITSDPGPGVIAENNLISNTTFDTVKNFNIHRLSIDKVKEGSLGITTIDKSVNTTLLGIKNNNLKDEFARTTSSNLYLKQKPNTDFKSEVSLTYDENDWKNGQINKYVAKYTIKKSNDTSSNQLNYKNNLKIQFKNTHIVRVGITGKNSNGRWPVMMDDSYMKLHVYYQIGDGTPTKIENLSKQFKFNHSTDSISNNSDYEWYGYDNSGNQLSGEDNWESTAWRYIDFEFKSNDFVITNTCKDFDYILKAYNGDKTINIYVMPEFYLYFKGQDGGLFEGAKKLIKNICVYTPVPVKIAGYSPVNASDTLVYSNNDDNIYKTKLNGRTVTGVVGSTISYKYDTKNEEGVKSTTICNDGVVFKTGDYIFGIGYSNAIYDHAQYGYSKDDDGEQWENVNDYNYLIGPMLFYHKYSEDYYKGNNTPYDDKTNNGYARRMNAIPLEDIFNIIKHARTDAKWQFGL